MGAQKKCPFCGSELISYEDNGVVNLVCPKCGYTEEAGDSSSYHLGYEYRAFSLEEYLLKKRTDNPQKRYSGNPSYYLDLKIRETQELLKGIFSEIERYFLWYGNKKMIGFLKIIKETVLDKNFLKDFFSAVHKKNSTKILKILIYKEFIGLGISKSDSIFLKEILFGKGYYCRLKFSRYDWPKSVLSYVDNMRKRIKESDNKNLIALEDFLEFIEWKIEEITAPLNKNNIYKSLLKILIQEDIKKEILEMVKAVGLKDWRTGNVLFLILLGRLIPFYAFYYTKNNKNLFNRLRIRSYLYRKTIDSYISRIVQKVISKYLGISEDELAKTILIYIQSFSKCNKMVVPQTKYFAHLGNSHRLILFYSLLKKYRGYNKSFSEYLKELKRILKFRDDDKIRELVLSRYMSLKKCHHYPLPL